MAKRPSHPMDPRNLIFEAYRIEGISDEDCRSIFFDWALGLPGDVAPGEAAEVLLRDHACPEGHPMTALLGAAVEGSLAPRTRQGGRQGRRRR